VPAKLKVPALCLPVMAGDTTGGEEDGTPSFAIPVHPTRRFPYDDGVTYEGGTTFALTPAGDRSTAELVALVEGVLSAGPYRFGDFFDLPMPVYLARDDGTGDVFRVSVRDGRVRLHVLPETEPDGLCAFYRRLTDRSGGDRDGWNVERRTET